MIPITIRINIIDVDIFMYIKLFNSTKILKI
jgi:hypothetical protein